MTGPDSCARDPAPEAQTIKGALGRAAAEAQNITEGLRLLDRHLGTELNSTPDADPLKLQKADLLRQEAEGLAAFLFGLANQTDASLGCDSAAAASSLSLQAQRARLSGEEAVTTASPVELWED